MAAQLEHKTHKVADVEVGNGYTLQVVRDYTRMKKPLLVYVAYWDRGWKRRKVDEFDSMVDALKYMVTIVAGGKDWCV